MGTRKSRCICLGTSSVGHVDRASVATSWKASTRLAVCVDEHQPVLVVGAAVRRRLVARAVLHSQQLAIELGESPDVGGVQGGVHQHGVGGHAMPPGSGRTVSSHHGGPTCRAYRATSCSISRVTFARARSSHRDRAPAVWNSVGFASRSRSTAARPAAKSASGTWAYSRRTPPTYDA